MRTYDDRFRVNTTVLATIQFPTWPKNSPPNPLTEVKGYERMPTSPQDMFLAVKPGVFVSLLSLDKLARLCHTKKNLPS
jgi:hypothetical protein